MPYVSGPTKATITPNPFIDKVKIEYSGANYSGTVYKHRIRYCYATSKDGKTWPNRYTSAWTWEDYPSTKSSDSFTVDLSKIEHGLYGTAPRSLDNCNAYPA